MTDENEGRRILDEKIQKYMEERRATFSRGFARFVIRMGHGALCSIEDPKTKQPITWQARGRQLYGVELFNRVMREELAALKEKGDAEEGLSSVRSDQGEDGCGRQPSGGSEDPGSEDHERGGRPSATATETSPSHAAG